MWQGGIAHAVDSLRISLQETRHHFNNFVSEIKDVSLKKRQKLSQIMLKMIAHKPLKKRGARFEPRVKKRRPKSYPLMQEPRSIFKQKIA